MAYDGMMQRSVLKTYFGKLASCFIHSFLHGDRNFTRLSFTHAYAAIAIAHYRKRCKPHYAAALYHFGYAVDRNHFFAQAITALLATRHSVCLQFRHFVS